MTRENLSEFLDERVMVTRAVHHIEYPLDTVDPAVAVIIDCAEDATTVVILPTFARGVLHLETHFFADGERTPPTINIPEPPEDACIELTLRKPTLVLD